MLQTPRVNVTHPAAIQARASGILALRSLSFQHDLSPVLHPSHLRKMATAERFSQNEVSNLKRILNALTSTENLDLPSELRQQITDAAKEITYWLTPR